MSSFTVTTSCEGKLKWTVYDPYGSNHSTIETFTKVTSIRLKINR
jgi:hypothetical protein